MPERPAGTVTFLFTDVEGSTRLMEQHPRAYRDALARHNRLLRDAVAGPHDGHVFESIGDALYAAFEHASAAMHAAVEGQLALQRETWGPTGQLKVRMGLHTGEVERWGDHYFGAPLYRCARLMAVAHGGQILLSQVTADLVRHTLPPQAALRALGEHQLRDLAAPEFVYQLLHPELPADFPPLRTLQNRPNNLPAQPTPFIGRQREVDAVRHGLLRRPEVRLLTLLGPGGTGKTRLALQVAVDSLDDFPDGVFFVPLARIGSPELVLPAIAQALGLREVSERPLLEGLTDTLRGRRLLLILDNFEHVAGAAPVVAALLAGCPRLKIMVTSRAVLQLYGEREFFVPPLSLPDSEHLPPAEELAQNEAVRLFVERAQDISPTFAINDTSARAVAEICRRLDGLPLAIELAAARTRLLSPEAILARLVPRLGAAPAARGDQGALSLLTRGARDLPERQQTLSNTIAWSYDLLDEAEQTLFRQLSVFVGGCTLEGAEAVCDAPPGAASGILDGLESLAAKSLIRKQEIPERRATDSFGASTRFLMLEVIREFGLARLLESGDLERIRRRHARYYAVLTEQAAPELRGPDQAAWLERLFQERRNLRAALRWSLDSGETLGGLSLAGSLWLFWHVKGYLTEGREWLSQLLDAPGGDAPTAARVRALVGLGVLSCDLGLPEARALIEEGVALARTLPSKADLGSALGWLGYVVQESDPQASRRANEEAMLIGRELGNRVLMSRALNNLGEIARRDQDFARAAALYEESLAMAYELGHQLRMAAALHNLGHVALARGDAPGAASRLAESLGIGRELGDQRIIAHCLAGLAAVAVVTGEAQRAARLFGAAEVLLESLKARFDPADQLVYERHLAAARATLGPPAFEAARAAGREMPLAQAVALAVEPDLLPLSAP
jgi:predicted ATPase/class 3 adenylate cyclase